MHKNKKSTEISEDDIKDLKNTLINLINNSFQNDKRLELIQFKNNIAQLLRKEFDEFIKYFFKNPIKNQKENISKLRALSTNTTKVIKIPYSFGLDFFTTKDIQNENKIITRNFHKKVCDLIKDNKMPNKMHTNMNLEHFLYNVAENSKISIQNSKKLNDYMKKEYLKDIGKKDYIDSDLKDFSIWVKRTEKSNKNIYNIFLKNEKIKYSSKETKDYLKELYDKLLILYFHCQLSFPPIEINFNITDNIFNEETMIDFLNYGKGKVKFAFFPSLYSNGNYLDNSKLWVYTCKENEI